MLICSILCLHLERGGPCEIASPGVTWEMSVRNWVTLRNRPLGCFSHAITVHSYEHPSNPSRGHNMQFMPVLWKLHVFTDTPSMGGVYNVLPAHQVRGLVPLV